MLIIAQPKSGSTSLLDTLHEITGWPRPWKLSGRDKRKVWDLPHISMVNYSYKEMNKMANDEAIYKRHIPPTQNNVSAIKNGVKCVVLLRNPDRSLEAYERHKNPHGMDEGKIWNESAKQTKLVLLNRFNQTWKRVTLKNVFHLEFKDLIVNPTENINKILEFYNLPIVENIDFKKARFSGWALKNLEQEEY